jgi:hypothetical protein
MAPRTSNVSSATIAMARVPLIVMRALGSTRTLRATNTPIFPAPGWSTSL